MRTLKLMPDYDCFPLWEVGSPEHSGDVDPNSLPISPALKTKLLEWARRFDRTLNRSDPVGSGFHDAEEEAQFWREGAALGELLRKEFGFGYSVHVWIPSGER